MKKNILIFCLCILISCTDKQSKEKTELSEKQDTQQIKINQENNNKVYQPKVIDNSTKDAKQYFNQGIQLLQERGFFLLTKKDTLTYLKAAKFIEKAINIDSTYINAYTNLAQIYFKIDSNKKALEVLNNLLYVKPDYVEAITSKGFILERMGKIKDAEENYKKALQIYNFKLNKTYNDYINTAFLVLLLYGEDEAYEKLDNIKNKFPKKDLKIYRNQFKNFNRNEFIKNSLN